MKISSDEAQIRIVPEVRDPEIRTERSDPESEVKEPEVRPEAAWWRREPAEGHAGSAQLAAGSSAAITIGIL